MKNLVSIIITTHGTSDDLPCILNSLRGQKEYGPGKNSVDGSPYLYECRKVHHLPMEIIITADGHSFYKEGLIEGITTYPSQSLSNPQQGSPGHHTREPGIMAAKGDWIVLTNQDNYFMLGWRHAIEKYLTDDVGMVYWDGISNLWKWSNFGGSKLMRGHIDLSFACVRTEIARVVGFEWRNYDGDFDYLDSCAQICRKQGLKIIHVEEVLSVHN